MEPLTPGTTMVAEAIIPANRSFTTVRKPGVRSLASPSLPAMKGSRTMMAANITKNRMHSGMLGFFAALANTLLSMWKR